MLKKIIVLAGLLVIALVLLLLTTQQSSFSVESHRDYQVSQAGLWQVLAEVRQWPRWWPGAEKAELAGSFSTGNAMHLDLKGMSAETPVILTRVDRPRILIWERSGVLMSRAGTRFDLEPIEGGCRLRIENFIRGPQAMLAHITGEEAFLKYQSKLLENLDLYLQSRPISGGEKD
ncbi:SRPBCC family protein [Geopsychrobacter electrodiphilus]|uniref:SRPBCC family protein n=1 Tax=Geopsychrobacter electrodiphilus TaxID=225196 RepID=UPI000381127E|nr:SRPBCC family protein [Geopsychrobacter electrodiphilus]